MRRALSITGVIQFFIFTLGFGQAANHVVISEVSPMKGGSTAFNTGEFIELYNPLPTPVTFGVNVQLISGNTTGTNAAEWQLSLSGITIQAYGFYLVGDGGVGTRNSAFPASKNLSNSGVRSCIQLRDGATIIDAFAWDASTLTGEGTKFTPSSTSSDGKSFERKSGPLATGPSTQGNAWDSNNNATDFYENTSAAASPQNAASPPEVHPYAISSGGSGSATISPSRWRFSTPTSFQFILKPLNDTLRALRMTRSTLTNWDTTSIALSMPAATRSMIGDTLYVKNFFLAGLDSIVITISGVTAPDTTDEIFFDIRTSTDGTTFGGIATQPSTLVYGNPRTINSAKRKETNGVHSLLGRWVVVRGVVTVANEFGGPSFMQDATAGMGVFDSTVSRYVERGDDVVLLGKVAPFNNLFELAPCTILEKLSEGNNFDTLVLSSAQINGQPQAAIEPYEGRLVRVNAVGNVVTSPGGVPTATWAVTGSGTNYSVTDPSGLLEVRISPRINLANTPVPSGAFDLVGVVSQYITYYQIQPRSYDDIIVEGQGPRLVSSPPYESNILPSGLTIRWITDVPGNSTVRYGLTPTYGTTMSDTTSVTDHSIVISGLTPATVYHMQFSSTNLTGTTNSPDIIVSTASLASTGVINVYFNKSVKTALARGESALGNENFPARLAVRIDAATTSIDAALYSLSGTVGANVATALINAKNRGIKVRVVGEKDNQTQAPWTTLKNAGIPVIDDGFDATNAGAGLMHNKFIVIDNRDSTSDTDDWVWTGSWNLTDPGTNDDMQNVIEVQDKAVANAFTMEFNEMWGSSTDTPNAAASRFGARKYDNTPHLFVVNGTPIEVSFSPSDRTTGRIITAITNAQYSVGFSLLTITRSDIANALVAKKNAGLRVHGVVDNRSDQGSQVDTLIVRGVDARIDVNSGMLHHKYCVIDAEGSGTNGVTITGSHNWSSSAENSNNENTLLVRSDRIANLYLQEFAERYQESGGTELVTVGVEGDAIPVSTELAQNYPNPFNPNTVVSYQLSVASRVDLRVYDVLGREVAVLVDGEQSLGAKQVRWDARGMTSGIYFYQLRAGGNVLTKKMILLR